MKKYFLLLIILLIPFISEGQIEKINDLFRAKKIIFQHNTRDSSFNQSIKLYRDSTFWINSGELFNGEWIYFESVGKFSIINDTLILKQGKIFERNVIEIIESRRKRYYVQFEVKNCPEYLKLGIWFREFEFKMREDGIIVVPRRKLDFPKSEIFLVGICNTIDGSTIGFLELNGEKTGTYVVEAVVEELEVARYLIKGNLLVNLRQ